MNKPVKVVVVVVVCARMCVCVLVYRGWYRFPPVLYDRVPPVNLGFTGLSKITLPLQSC